MNILYVQYRQLAEVALLFSAIRETMRYTASVISTCHTHWAVGLGGHRFETDDEVVCATGVIHLNEEIRRNVSEDNFRRER